jgi:hypothetical protein
MKNEQDSKRFKAGRLRAGDAAIRLMEEDGELWRDRCVIFKITRKFIICEIKMADKVLRRDTAQQTIFDKKTGINIRGKDWGWLEKPKKRKNLESKGEEI